MVIVEAHEASMPRPKPKVANMTRGDARKTSSDDEPVDGQASWTQIVGACAAMAWSVASAANLPEIWWYAQASILAKCEDGRSIFHQLSSQYDGYDQGEADAKFDQAARASPPRTCTGIREDLQFDGCLRCPFWRTA